MSKLLFEIESYRGEGMALYEAKVAEAIALVANEQKRQGRKPERPLTQNDLAGLENVVSYIGDHYAFDLPLEQLSSAHQVKNLLQTRSRLHHHGIHSGPPHGAGGGICSSTPTSPWGRLPR